MLGLQPQFTVGRGGGTGACTQECYKLKMFTNRVEEVNKNRFSLLQEHLKF
jgi:hypothetical protein